MPEYLVRKRGWYHFRAKVKDEDGTSHWVYRSLGTKNRATARSAARILFEEYKLGIRKVGKPVTLGEFLERWIREDVTPRRAKRQVRDAEARIRKHCEPEQGRPLPSLTSGDLTEMRLRQEEYLAANTVRHTMTDVGALLSFAVKKGVIQSSPFDRRTHLPKPPEDAPKRLSDIELHRVMRAAAEVPEREPGKYLQPLTVLLETGLRWGELVRLAWSDVDMADGWLRIHHTKNKKLRHVPMTARVRRIFAGLSSGVRFTAGRVFELPSHAQHIAKMIRRASGVASFHVHQFRHTFASQFVERGGSLEALRQILGHGSGAMVRRYGVPDPEWLRGQMCGHSVDTTEATS